MPKKKIVKKPKKKTQKEIHNDLLRNIFIGLGGIIVVILAIYFTTSSLTNFTYKDVDFKMIKEGELIFYETGLPVTYQGQQTTYNFYIRNDPRELENIPFNGTPEFVPLVALNSEGDYTCGGYGGIAIANLANLYKVMGSKVVYDENSTCDSESRYLFLNFKDGNETYIDQIGTACYDLYVNDCEIMEVTEKMLVESLVKINSALSEEPIVVSAI